MQHDVLIVGGGYAGMAAALQLLRARRTVRVLDAGLRRNRFASRSHGFLTQDGADAGEIAATARRQLEAYRTLSWMETSVERLAGEKDAFVVTHADGSRSEGRRLLLATGVADTLPEVEGLAERWGRSVFHCPYCHGYELDEGRIGVIAAGPMSVHQAQLVSEWGETTFFLNGVAAPDAEVSADLRARGVTVETTPIARVEDEAVVRLTDGRALPFAGLFVATRTTPPALATTLGCETEETPLGVQLRTDGAKETSVAGAYACGDVARSPHSVTLAVGDGAWAGMQIHRSLVF